MKKVILNTKEYPIKLELAGVYGNFNLYDSDIAQKVTEEGQKVLKDIQMQLDLHENDNSSVYSVLKDWCDLVNKSNQKDVEINSENGEIKFKNEDKLSDFCEIIYKKVTNKLDDLYKIKGEPTQEQLKEYYEYIKEIFNSNISDEILCNLKHFKDIVSKHYITHIITKITFIDLDTDHFFTKDELQKLADICNNHTDYLDLYFELDLIENIKEYNELKVECLTNQKYERAAEFRLKEKKCIKKLDELKKI